MSVPEDEDLRESIYTECVEGLIDRGYPETLARFVALEEADKIYQSLPEPDFKAYNEE